MQDTSNIVIVGGGFAGTMLARSLQRRLPEGRHVVLVSEESYTTFNPMLAEVVGAAVFPDIRNRVLQRIARIELESDPVARQRLGHFIVIGGGFSGVEVAGGVADFLRDALRYYRRVQPHELKVSVLQDADRLLLELPESLGAAALRSLEARHIKVRLKARAARVAADGVTLASGEFISGSTVICTIGTRPNPLVERLPCPKQRGRIETEPDMSVAGLPGVWAIGDCAWVRNGTTGQFAPPTAQFAVAQARALANNIVAAIERRATTAFSHSSRGMMATTGHLKGVAQVFGLRLTGLPAWLLWRAYYLLLMPTLGRKVRIFVEWTWSMFFPADITHRRFTRTAQADAPEPAVPASSPSP